MNEHDNPQPIICPRCGSDFVDNLIPLDGLPDPISYECIDCGLCLTDYDGNMLYDVDYFTQANKAIP